MLDKDDLWLVEEPAVDEPTDVLTIPEIRHYLIHDPPDEELGLRSLLEDPEALSRAWRRGGKARPRRATGKSGRRHHAPLHAA